MYNVASTPDMMMMMMMMMIYNHVARIQIVSIIIITSHLRLIK